MSLELLISISGLAGEPRTSQTLGKTSSSKYLAVSGSRHRQSAFVCLCFETRSCCSPGYLLTQDVATDDLELLPLEG